MTTSTINPPRQEAGAPASTGGQFKAYKAPEATGPLSRGMSAEERAAWRAEYAAKRESRQQERVNGKDLYENANRVARIPAIRYNLSPEDSDDVVAETLMSVIQTKANNPGVAIRGELINKASFAVASRYMDSHSSSANSRAFKMWKEAVTKREAELGRSLNGSEKDEIADTIRSNWHDQDRKPARGYQNPVQVLSSDAYKEKFSEIQADEGPAVDKGSKFGHALADDVEDKLVDKLEARKLMWNFLADDTNAPLTTPGTVNASASARYRREVKGDVVSVAERWVRGQATEKESMALFAPFGRLDAAGKEAVAVTLVQRRSYGHKLWLGALEHATGDPTAAQ